MRKYAVVIMVLLAVASGLTAVFIANHWLSSKAAQVEANKVDTKEDTLPVSRIVIAASDIEVGTRITEESLTLADWPRSTVPRGAFTEMEQLIGRVSVTKLSAGQPVLGAELASSDSGAGLVALLEPGKRAMSIQVNEVVGVGGFVLPNTYVDVIAVKKTGQRTAAAETILERIKVLAIAQEMHTEESKPKLVKTVTLLVSPDEAVKLAQKVNEGTIHLVLRNPGELVEVKEPVEQEPEVVVQAPAPAAPPPRVIPTLKSRVKVLDPTPFAVTIIRGDKPPETIKFKNVESEERM